MISVFTPSNDTKYLDEAYQSLLDQTYTDWEWVVVLNGNATQIPIWSPEDERVKVYRTNEFDGNIGALKRYACDKCEGPILVELDHDDILMPRALESIRETFFDHPDASLVYSNYASIDGDGKPLHTEYSETYGWEYENVGEYHMVKAMSSHPHNVAHIWWAPNHVRAFRASSYKTVGGYNAELSILDDQDLMIRLYNEGRFVHIPKLLYLQRNHDGNTQKVPEINAQIQVETVRMANANINEMARNWALRRNKNVLSLSGYYSDKYSDVEDDSLGVIEAHDYVQFLKQPFQFIEDCYSMLCDGGMLFITVPSTDGRGAFQDLRHQSFWNENSFWYLTSREYGAYYGLGARFQVSNLTTYFPSEWHKANNISYVRATLIAVKSEGHQFGGVLLI